jgi:hypothetical protein
MTTRSSAFKLAKQLGVELEFYRKRWHGGGVQVCNLYLPEGMVFDGNEGLDALHHECELDDDIWPGVLADLESLKED